MAEGDWDRLAAALGGVVEDVPMEAGTAGRVAYGTLDDLSWTLIGEGSQAYVIEVDTCSGGALAAVRDDYLADPGLGRAMASAGGPPLEEALGVRSELVQLRLVTGNAGMAVGDGLVEVVRAVVACTRRHATLLEDDCWGCGAPHTPLGRPYGQTVRLCAACREAVDTETAAVEAQARAEGATDDEADDGDAMFQAEVFGGTDHERLRLRGERLAVRAAADPGRFRLALLGWVLAGQALLASGAILVGSAVVAVVGLLLGLVLTGRAFALLLFAKVLLLKLWKLLLFAAVGLAATGRTLWAGLQRRYGAVTPRSGVRLSRSDAPRLFAWLDGIAQRVEAPLPDVVVVDTALNASAGELHHEGAWQRVVTVGVPFLELFSVAELEAVMAHELGHLRHEDARELWVFRTMDAWRRAVLGSEGVVGAVVRRAARWYLPEFLLRAQVVSRGRERAADAAALRVAAPEVQARALIRIGVVGGLLERALRIAARHALATDVDVNPYDRLWDALPEIPDAVVQAAYRDALEAPTHWLDSHPGLRDRLAALGVDPPPRADVVGHLEARSHTLVDRWEAVRAEASDAQRRVAVLQLGRARRAERRRLSRLTAVDARLAVDPADAPAQVLRARLLSAGDDDAAALDAYDAALSLDPTHREARREQTQLLVWVARTDDAGRAADALLALPDPPLDDRQFAAEVWARAGRSGDAARALQALAEHEDVPDAVRGSLRQRADVLSARSEVADQGVPK